MQNLKSKIFRGQNGLRKAPPFGLNSLWINEIEDSKDGTAKQDFSLLSKPLIWFNRDFEDSHFFFSRSIKLAIWDMKNPLEVQSHKTYKTN
jgi:hypothetical protein